jgi:uncharacterized protein YbjQ (UPF0145 family)
MKCSNCSESISKPLIGKENKALDESSLKKINDFLPDELRQDSFCHKCSSYNHIRNNSVYDTHIYSKYSQYLNKISKKYKFKLTDLNNLKSNINDEKGRLFPEFETVVLYSNTPKELELIEFIESYSVVDTGMWSTSSDNLDAVWSAIHDNIARKGSDTDNKLLNAFELTKEVLRKQAFMLSANSVVDVKYNFSELAGNGKILMYCSGTAAINPKKKVPQLNNIESKFKNQLEGLNSEIKELKSFLIEKSDDNFKALLKEINLSRNN